MQKSVFVSISAMIVSALLLSEAVFAHHSLLGYNRDELVEVQGEITAIFWRNPHIGITIRSDSTDDSGELWEIEGGPVNTMERRGISRDSIHVGDNVSVFGFGSTRVGNTLAPIYISLASGDALVLDDDAATSFGLVATSQPNTGAALDDEAVAAAIRDAHGIYRVWSNRDRHWIADSREWGVSILPLTESARLAQESWNQPTDDITLQCIPAGMPEAMLQPFPIEFVESNGDILLHIEEWDNVRTIHMGDGEAAEDPGHLGYSVGRWEGNTLIVETTDIDYPFLDDRGTPQSDALEIVERFTLSEDETRLDWTATVTDPETFTEPFDLPELHWDWIPGEHLRQYNCTVGDDQTPWGQRRQLQQ